MLAPEQVEKILTRKGTKFVTVTFVKKDGTIRKINGLLRPLSHIKGTGRKPPEYLVPIWSPREGWRSFRKDQVVDVR